MTPSTQQLQLLEVKCLHLASTVSGVHHPWAIFKLSSVTVSNIYLDEQFLGLPELRGFLEYRVLVLKQGELVTLHTTSPGLQRRVITELLINVDDSPAEHFL